MAFKFPLGLWAGNTKHRASGMIWYIEQEENFCHVCCMKFEPLMPKSNNSYQHVDVTSRHPARHKKPSQALRHCAFILYDTNIIYSIILVLSVVYHFSPLEHFSLQIANVRSGKPSYMNMLMKTTRSGEQHDWSIEPCFRHFALLHRLALVPILGYEVIHDGCRTTCRAISSCEDIHKQSARRTLVDWLHLRNLDLFRIAAVLYGPFWSIGRLNIIQCPVHPFLL